MSNFFTIPCIIRYHILWEKEKEEEPTPKLRELNPDIAEFFYKTNERLKNDTNTIKVSKFYRK